MRVRSNIVLRPLWFITIILIGLKKFADTPAELLASRDTTGACFDAAWQTVGGKGADF
ncbi:hypothetical protein J7J00_05715 [Bacillus sp. ISL-4]|uniref:hypothetical protein n=1 Tax=Bacillus sp. ISL-4 TaxID=2819125 RepID=UPI001BEA5D4F|nr:hypothetical protein [Bacillus sp. ISL-4]MBT2664984.1 hypothetical protein [Bacillus sp. ISL-4]